MLPRKVKHILRLALGTVKLYPCSFKQDTLFSLPCQEISLFTFQRALRRNVRPAIALCEKPTLLRLACQLFFFHFSKNFVASNGALSVLAHYLQLQLKLATKQCQVEICAFQKNFSLRELVCEQPYTLQGLFPARKGSFSKN